MGIPIKKVFVGGTPEEAEREMAKWLKENGHDLVDPKPKGTLTCSITVICRLKDNQIAAPAEKPKHEVDKSWDRAPGLDPEDEHEYLLWP